MINLRCVLRIGIVLLSGGLLLGSAGCSSSGGVRIPGENERILKNLASEYYAIAEGNLNLKNYTKAVEYYRLAMRSAEFERIAYYKIGYAYALAKDWVNAESVYRELLAQDPQNVSLAASLAYITAQKGDIDSALVQYEKLTGLQPFDQSLRENYTVLLVAAGRNDDAAKQLELLKTDFPDSTVIESLEKKLKPQDTETPDTETPTAEIPAIETQN